MSKINKKWARGLGTDGLPVYAPAGAIEVNGRLVINPLDVHYRIAGYMPVVDVAPAEPAPVGYHWAPAKWEIQVLQIVRLYVAVKDPPPMPRKFSKLKLYAALTEAGHWEHFEHWLKEQTIAGVNGYTAFSLAQELSDDHPLFAPLYAAVKVALGISDEDAEQILEAAQEV